MISLICGILDTTREQQMGNGNRVREFVYRPELTFGRQELMGTSVPRKSSLIVLYIMAAQ